MRSKKLLKFGGVANINGDDIYIQEDIDITPEFDLYNKIIEILNTAGSKYNSKIVTVLKKLRSVNSKDNIYIDIVNIVTNYEIKKSTFQSTIISPDVTMFGKYKLSEYETKRQFITIDPTIIQIMIFDDENNSDLIYSLKLIIREKNKLCLRYTTKLFPNESKIVNFADLSNFNNFNKNLNNQYIKTTANDNLLQFLKKYIKYYNFYKKCYLIDDVKQGSKTSTKKLIDYQLKYISILGKARFKNTDIQIRSQMVTDYVMSNLLFTSPCYAFISGGYKGFDESCYGITRSGYEIAKKYVRPILTIMCNEGKHDSHGFSDAELIYGEHWGEDSIALSQLTDGAIIIAPFGGWTYIECLTLLANKKIIAIFNDLYNILNYENYEQLSDEELKSVVEKEKGEYDGASVKEIEQSIRNKSINKISNQNFFNFNKTEQYSIIDYYINYYLILLYISYTHEPRSTLLFKDKVEIIKHLNCAIKLLEYLKTLFIRGITLELVSILTYINTLKNAINNYIKFNIETINTIYKKFCNGDDYQSELPYKCDGIWINPKFDLLKYIEKRDNAIATKYSEKKEDATMTAYPIEISKSISVNIDIYKINIDKLKIDPLFANINNNIIFVFSDVLYLNMYINNNLNATSYQTQIQNKINGLSHVIINGKSPQMLLKSETKRIINLNRSLDGFLHPKKKLLLNENIIKDKYSFVISETCNNYTTILEPYIPSV
jgi:hypothetical protein